MICAICWAVVAGLALKSAAELHWLVSAAACASDLLQNLKIRIVWCSGQRHGERSNSHASAPLAPAANRLKSPVYMRTLSKYCAIVGGAPLASTAACNAAR